MFPTKTGITVPWPPGLIGTTTVDGALTCDANVLGLEGIDTGREVETLQTLPRGLYDGVELGLEGELQNGTFLNMEVYTVLQGDGTCKELLSGRDDHASATFLRTEVDGFLDGFLVLGCRVGLFRPVLGDYILFIRKLR